MQPDLTADTIANFRQIVWGYYAHHARSMPWRSNPSPYVVLVSEVMLQQTQVGRVLPKFREFMACFPDLTVLAKAPFADVLRCWNGLGYNRRARFLWQAAQQVSRDFGGQVPRTLEELVTLPGVGRNTAGAIVAYAYNQPVVFVETNIRTVYLYHFFATEPVLSEPQPGTKTMRKPGQPRPDTKVADSQILPLVAVTLDTEHPREWYWALMDYGAHLKTTRGAGLHKFRHYVRQSAFQGSRRQLRGRIVRELLAGPLPRKVLLAACADERTAAVLAELQQEQLIIETDGMYQIAKV